MKVRVSYTALLLFFTAIIFIFSALKARADMTFDQLWRGRTGSDYRGTASVYWEDAWDARGKRFNPDGISCAHRTEPFGSVLVVKNLDNGRRVQCPVQDRGPFWGGRVIDLSRGAARKIACDGLCKVVVMREGFEIE